MNLGAFSISLVVRDLDASRAFYEALGFRMTGGDPAQGWLILKGPTAIIGLFQGMFERNMLTFNPGWDQDANALTRFTDVRAIQAALQARGLTLEATTDPDGQGPGHLMLTDPDGNPILIDQHAVPAIEQPATRHLGLIGGIGPAATLAYYQRLVAAFAARGQAMRLTIAHADVQTLARNAEADDRTAQARVFARHLSELKGAGAELATITSLGGHFCFDETQALSPLPLSSAIAPMDAAFAARGLKTIGLLGTRQVMGSALYGQLRQTKALAPTDLDGVHQTYVAIATTGQCTPDARDMLLQQGRSLMERGADAVVLAGTDLGLAFDGQDPGYPVVDAIDLHVAHLVDLACAPGVDVA